MASISQSYLSGNLWMLSFQLTKKVPKAWTDHPIADASFNVEGDGIWQDLSVAYNRNLVFSINASGGTRS